MSRNVRVLNCTPEDVFRVLADGWLYPSWVVGASRMRQVADSWPEAGSELHHSFGVWPMLIDDKTVVEEYSAPRHMVMRARGWPIGEARVTIDVKARGDDCVVRIEEEAVAGPGRLVPKRLMDIPLHWRNNETLQRLAFLAEGIGGASQTGDERAVKGRAETDASSYVLSMNPDDTQESLRKDTSYSPASETETQQKQTDPLPATVDDDIDPDDVRVVPGTGGPDDVGDVDVDPDNLNLPGRS